MTVDEAVTVLVADALGGALNAGVDVGDAAGMPLNVALGESTGRGTLPSSHVDVGDGYGVPLIGL